jgi:hypothetical protein
MLPIGTLLSAIWLDLVSKNFLLQGQYMPFSQFCQYFQRILFYTKFFVNFSYFHHTSPQHFPAKSGKFSESLLTFSARRARIQSLKCRNAVMGKKTGPFHLREPAVGASR